MSLVENRKALHKAILDLDLNDDDQGKAAATAVIRQDWKKAERLIKEWWSAYKAWESADTFNQAVAEHRMTMRSFDGAFDKLLNKTGPMNIASEDRFYANSDRQPVAGPPAGATSHKEKFSAIVDPKPTGMGWTVRNPKPPVVYGAPNRGINTTAFMKPANFKTRKLKYQLGLHDLSVKLVIPGRQWFAAAQIKEPESIKNPKDKGVKAQSHHSAPGKAYFCFLPLSKPEDQYVIYKLVRYAKALRMEIPDLYELILGYRSEMTRVKLAHGFDMGTGYIAVETKDRPDNIPYKVSYSIGNAAKERRAGPGTIGKVKEPVDSDLIRKRQQVYFKHNADVAMLGNEIVIAMRNHAGSFPVYAFSTGDELTCFTIRNDGTAECNPDGTPKPNGKTITAQGVANF